VTAARAAVEAAAAEACSRIAPLWPLKHFVAVNPFLGLSARGYHAVCASMHRIAGVTMLMPRAFYRQAVADAEIAERDFQEALSAAPADWNAPADVAALRSALAKDPRTRTTHPAHVPTVAQVLDSLAGGDAVESGTAFMVDEISKWCAAYFDEGQSVWRLPGRSMPAYPAWRAVARYDRNPEVMGIGGFRELIAGLPEDPLDAIAEVVHRQGVPERALADYLHQALLDIAGWAGYARYLVWNDALAGQANETLVHLLAIRISWGYALFAQRRDEAFLNAWHRAMAVAGLPHRDEQLGDDPDLCVDIIAHEAYEAARRRALFARLAPAPNRPAGASAPRPPVQAVFCIDGRSEIYRRALERAWPQAVTLGFGGFFGFPIEYVHFGDAHGDARCPALIAPSYVVCEGLRGATAAQTASARHIVHLRRRVAAAWNAFTSSAVSSFLFVETLGLFFGATTVRELLACARPSGETPLGPTLEPQIVDGRRTGLNEGERLALAESALRGMSLTAGFARLVLLVGHGSTSTNNPYATSLNCAACGDYSGEANARVAADVFNDPAVRRGLGERGIRIPDDTWFLGCRHDTATDELTLFDAAEAPAGHRDEIAAARETLALACQLARRDRAGALGIAVGRDTDRAVLRRSRDWSQVRPEWGSAGNAAFIAAPRSRTAGADLRGRAFLHEYDWRCDPDNRTLERIMTATVVVATWINLQYYGSTVDNARLGSGSKTIHNVAGIIGVLEGNAGDLKAGLPWQSVHDGTRFVHEPVRLSVVVEAPPAAIAQVVRNSETVRDLVENRWIHLFAMDDAGRVARRYAGAGTWAPA